MSKIQKIFIVLTISMTLFCPSFAQAQTSGQLFFCENTDRSWTLYESAQPRIFQQEISVQGPGTFTLTMQANGFGFEGFSYTRPSIWDKWKHVIKTKKGKTSWRQTWRVLGDEQRLGLLQSIKDSVECGGCTISMKMTSSNCQIKKPDTRTP